MKNFLKEEYHDLVDGNFLDLISNEKSYLQDSHYTKTLNLWGKGIHTKNKTKHEQGGDDTHIEKILEFFTFDNLDENFLEIGCGEGIDLRYIINNFKLKNICAVDIGENIKFLSQEKNLEKVNFYRCDCLNLPFLNNSFENIYSWGVFHHTKNFKKAILEAQRVLKKNGTLIFYSYAKRRYFKLLGVILENILLKLFSNLNYQSVKVLCYLISPVILILFSYPAQILRFLGSKKIYKYFPLWWGKHPGNIVDDLADRLYAPINLRFSKTEMHEILLEHGFTNIKIIEARDGLFCKVEK